ncbi:MAG TPA: hypothetical protein PLR25_05985 [Planctomycetaceae bacterium]|nr:hypothetical protein [Planctomycetaceae bacterium]
MIMMKNWVSSITLALLAGCSTSNQLSVLPSIDIQKLMTGTLILNHGSGYSLEIPNELFVWGDKTFYSTTAPPKLGEFPIYRLNAVDGYDLKIAVSAASRCVPDLTGASQVTKLTKSNAKTVWGRVDFYDTFPFNFGPEPFCKPANIEVNTCGEAGTENCSLPASQLTKSSAYILCSEHDDHSVLICISEVASNATLAKQIFETFRWLK